MPDAPLNYFLHSHGPATGPTLLLGWVFAACALAVCVIVAALLVYAILRRRERDEDTFSADLSAMPRSLVHNRGNGLRAVAAGTAVSTLLLFALAAYALVVLRQVGAAPVAPALTLRVTGYDWWWRVDYPAGADGAAAFVTANEVHIPVGVPVRLMLDSADVIHAFWVPQLAGKTQMIPGAGNEQWLQADAPGVYRGQCTQFCGSQHAHMALEVVAQARPDYEHWREAQRRGAAEAAASAALTPGRALFLRQCAGCHALRGLGESGGGDAGGHGPDLTHLASRRLIGAGLLPNTPAMRLDWITHVQAYKPGSRMPDMVLNAAEQADLGAFLTSLQ